MTTWSHYIPGFWDAQHVPPWCLSSAPTSDVSLHGPGLLWGSSWVLCQSVESKEVVVVSHTATSQEDSVGNVEASIVLWISLEAQARGWCVSCLGPHCRQAKHVTHETSRCYSNFAIDLKLPDDEKNITKLYDIQMVGLILIQTVSWCFQIDIVSKFSKSNGKPVSLISCTVSIMYQFAKNVFSLKKSGIHSQHPSMLTQDPIRIGQLVLQLSRLLKLLALHHSLSDGHRILWGDLKKKKLVFPACEFLTYQVYITHVMKRPCIIFKQMKNDMLNLRRF